MANRDSTPLTSGGANTRGTNTRRNFRAQHPRRRNNRRKSRKRNRTRNRRRNLLLRTLRRRLPRSIDQVPFNTRQLAAIRYKQWKLLTGNQGYNGIVPNPVINISACKFIGLSKTCSVPNLSSRHQSLALSGV